MKGDFCKEESDNINTIILYSKAINYCKNCKDTARQIRIAMKYKIRQLNKWNKEFTDMEIRAAENDILGRY